MRPDSAAGPRHVASERPHPPGWAWHGRDQTMAVTSPALRRVSTAIALPGFPLALLLGSLVSPTGSSANTDQLVAAGTDPNRWQAAALFELLAAALVPFAIAGVLHRVRHRGAGLANSAAVLGVLGSLGMAAISFRHLFIGALSAAHDPTANSVLDALDNRGGVAIFALMMALPVALVLLAGATARAGLVSAWVVPGAIVFALVDSFPLPWAEEVQGLVGLVTFGVIAAATLRSVDEDSRLGAPQRLSLPG